MTFYKYISGLHNRIIAFQKKNKKMLPRVLGTLKPVEYAGAQLVVITRRIHGAITAYLNRISVAVLLGITH